MQWRGWTPWAAVVVNESGSVVLDACLRALFACDHPPVQVVVVDNASTDDSLVELSGWPQVAVEAIPTRISRGAAANRGIAATEAPLVAVLTPDVAVDAGFGRALAERFARDPDLGAASAKLRDPERGVIRQAGGELERPLLFLRRRGEGLPDGPEWSAPRDEDAALLPALALRRVALDAVGGFDERFWPAGYEDVDLSLRMRAAGWRVRYEPSLTGIQQGVLTALDRGAEADALHRNRLRLALKHLPAVEWWSTFLPAEIGRLRAALVGDLEPDWPETTGAAAIAALAAGGGAPGGVAGLLRGGPLAEVAEALRAVDALAAEPAPRSRRGWSARLASALGLDRGQERQADERARLRLALSQALAAQDRLNRELVSEVLLALLCLLPSTVEAATERGGPPGPGRG